MRELLHLAYGFVNGSIADPSHFCNGNSFYNYNVVKWTSIAVPQSRWIGFGEQLSSQSRNDHFFTDLHKHLAERKFRDAGDLLWGLFANGDLAGALAEFSPIEDFVEAYELTVLINANPALTDLLVTINGFPHDILPPGALKPALMNKMNCFTG